VVRRIYDDLNVLEERKCFKVGNKKKNEKKRLV